MERITPEKLAIDAVDLWKNKWLLLTAGTMDDCNMMTVAWGSIGCMWNRPFAQVVVRPQRHTLKYMDLFESFTLCGFPDKYHKDLLHLGTVSGRDCDKLEGTELTLKPSESVLSPVYNEASLTLECRKMYRQAMSPEGFITDTGVKVYPDRDYHVIFYGEIVNAFKA